jgi:hypothetical protein
MVLLGEVFEVTTALNLLYMAVATWHRFRDGCADDSLAGIRLLADKCAAQKTEFDLHGMFEKAIEANICARHFKFDTVAMTKFKDGLDMHGDVGIDPDVPCITCLPAERQSSFRNRMFQLVLVGLLSSNPQSRPDEKPGLDKFDSFVRFVASIDTDYFAVGGFIDDLPHLEVYRYPYSKQVSEITASSAHFLAVTHPLQSAFTNGAVGKQLSSRTELMRFARSRQETNRKDLSEFKFPSLDLEGMQLRDTDQWNKLAQLMKVTFLIQ